MEESSQRERPAPGIWRFLSLACTYSLFWAVTRWPAIRHNTLFFDDYGIPAHPADFYIGSYRPLVWVEYVLWELIVPNHLWTVLPKITASIYLGLFGAMIAALLTRWRVPHVVAAAIPFVVLANPVLNDAGLWNSLHALPLGLLLFTAGMFVWERGSRSAWLGGTLLMLCGTMVYQVFISLAIVWLASEIAIKSITGGQYRFADTLKKLGVLAIVAVIQIGHMELVRSMAERPDVRGFAAPGAVTTFALEKLHGMSNLAVNGVMPVIAWYAGAETAFSAWKFVPLSIAAATVAAAMLRRRRLGEVVSAAVFPIVVFFLPAVPILIMSQSAYAWRVSSPTAVAVAMSLLPLLLYVGGQRTCVWIGPAAMAVIVMVPVSHYEAGMRVVSQDREARLMRDIVAHWNGEGVPRDHITIVYGPRRLPEEDVRLIGPHDLTWGYDRRSPGMFSSFDTAWFATQFVTRFHKLQFVDCSENAARNGCADVKSLCDRNCSDTAALTPRVTYVGHAGTTLVCAGTAPPGTRTRCGAD